MPLMVDSPRLSPSKEDRVRVWDSYQCPPLVNRVVPLMVGEKVKDLNIFGRKFCQPPLQKVIIG